MVNEIDCRNPNSLYVANWQIGECKSSFCIDRVFGETDSWLSKANSAACASLVPIPGVVSFSSLAW